MSDEPEQAAAPQAPASVAQVSAPVATSSPVAPAVAAAAPVAPAQALTQKSVEVKKPEQKSETKA